LLDQLLHDKIHNEPHVQETRFESQPSYERDDEFPTELSKVETIAFGAKDVDLSVDKAKCNHEISKVINIQIYAKLTDFLKSGFSVHESRVVSENQFLL